MAAILKITAAILKNPSIVVTRQRLEIAIKVGTMTHFDPLNLYRW